MFLFWEGNTVCYRKNAHQNYNAVFRALIFRWKYFCELFIKPWCFSALSVGTLSQKKNSDFVFFCQECCYRVLMKRHFPCWKLFMWPRFAQKNGFFLIIIIRLAVSKLLICNGNCRWGSKWESGANNSLPPTPRKPELPIYHGSRASVKVWEKMKLSEFFTGWYRLGDGAVMDGWCLRKLREAAMITHEPPFPPKKSYTKGQENSYCWSKSAEL